MWWLNCIKIYLDKIDKSVYQNIKDGKVNSTTTNVAETVGMSLMKKYPNIEIRPWFFPLHNMSMFSEHAMACPNADEVYDSLFCVPSSALLTERDIKEIAGCVKESFNEILGIPVM